MTREAGAPLLSIRDLVVSYRHGEVHAVRGASFDVQPGTTTAVVGESGSGKSTTVLSVLGLLPPGARIDGGSISYGGEELSSLSDRAIRRFRGKAIGLVPQDPTLSLDPTIRVGRQVAETLVIHRLSPKRQALVAAVDFLAAAGMDDPARRARQYPHELSGGMRQRVLLAMAWACKPRLILADEPTSALDATIQRQVLDHLDRLRAESGTTVVLVTHDLAVASERAQHVVVMARGEVVEQGSPAQILGDPQHGYTRTLVMSMPHNRPIRATARARARADAARPAPPILRAEHLVKEFDAHHASGARFRFKAVDDVSFDVEAGETVSLVGESGSGKTTTARMVMCLERPSSGSLEFNGDDLSSLSRSALRRLRREFQMVQQNPFSSLDPKFTVRQIIEEPLRAFGVGDRATRRARVVELLEVVALVPRYAERMPAELSGGQRQRVAIARAIALDPKLLVCDEPVSALDATVQGQILDLLSELQEKLNLSLLFISHDLSVVRAISDRVGVMSSGKLLEMRPTEEIFDAPEHEYTMRLIESIPGRRVPAESS